MRTLYDAVTAGNIPRFATMVAGYIDKIKLEPWSAADWALFPHATKVEIVKKATTNAGHVLDVEPGDATPAQAPGWAAMRRKAGADPTVYCNYSTWPSVQAEFTKQGVAQPHYWIAKYDGKADLPTLNGITAVAKQYKGDVSPGIDISCVADYWPGVDPAPEEDELQPDEREALFRLYEQFCGQGAVPQDPNKRYPGWDTVLGKKTVVDILREVLATLRGMQDSRIANDKNKTNMMDLAFDSAKWTFEDKATLASLNDKLTQVLAKLEQ